MSAGASSLALLVTLSTRVQAQEPPPHEGLAQKTQNPVAKLVSVPLQSNFNFGVGPGRDIQYILNLQPAFPMSLTEDWYLIHRFSLSLAAQPETVEGHGGAFGLGDLQYQVYLTPAAASEFVWGVGPLFSFATATSTLLGSGRSSLGPTGVAVLTEGPWVVGALVNQLWSYSANPSRSTVSQLTIQPLLNFNLPEQWYLTATPVMSANWKAESGQKWTIPVGAGVGKIAHFSYLPVNLQIQVYWNAVHPDGGPRWSLGLQIQLLFPR